ncbi:MAG: SMI1/KNR4 family protein [Chthoniobacter sp.]|nr:SMI1/KNR4 family protein [Chthoniobacter sp.]
MTDQDFQSIEKCVGFPLPAYYRATLSSYPFAANSFAAEFMLPNDLNAVIELSDAEISSPEIRTPLFVGTDGSEEWFFVDASKPDSGVFAFELETGKHRLLTPTWGAFLDHIRAHHAEIAADEEAMRQRKLNKKCWEFWK